MSPDSGFDSAFRKAVDYLSKSNKLVKQDFAKQIEVSPTTLSDILSGKRNVPKHKVELAKFVLSKDYNIRGGFLKTNTGQMLEKPEDVDINIHPQYAQLLKENQELKQKIKVLEALTKTQLQLIENLQSKK